MGRIMKLAVAGAFFTLALVGSASNASASIVSGDTLDLTYLFPDTSTVYQDNTTTYTGPGTALPVIYTGSATFDADQVVISQNDTYSYTPGSFNGVEITDTTNTNAFADWTVLSSNDWSGFTEYQSGGSIFVNWQSTSVNSDSTITIGATPLPSTWTMLIAGFAGLGFFAYRGSKKNAAGIAAA
jgi:hypothetical protein